MKILITGITGRVGANVARRFLKLGHEVRGLVWADDPQAAKMARVGAEIVPGDLRLLSDVRRATSDRDTIFHLGAAFQAGGPFTPEQYFDTNVKGTFNVLESALELGPRLKHVIYVSTDATMDKYPPGGIREPLTETSLPADATHWYGYTKVSPMFRLGHYIGLFEDREDAAGRATHRALKAEDDGGDRLLLACDGRGRPYKKHVVDVRDLVHAFDAAAGKEATFGRLYQLAAPEPFAWDEAVPHLASVLKLPYSRVNLDGTPTFYEYDLAAARRDFGFAPRHAIKDTIDEAARYAAGATEDIIPTRVD